MKLKVIGAKHRSRMIREATIYFLDKLIPKYKQTKLDITLRLTRKMNKHDMGEMEYDKGVVKIYSYPYANDWTLLRTIAHEVVHVKQGVMDGLWDYKNGDVRYKGIRYKIKENADEYAHPWEIEAMGRERGLVINFLESKGMYTWDRMRKKESIYLLL